MSEREQRIWDAAFGAGYARLRHVVLGSDLKPGDWEDWASHFARKYADEAVEQLRRLRLEKP